MSLRRNRGSSVGWSSRMSGIGLVVADCVSRSGQVSAEAWFSMVS